MYMTSPYGRQADYPHWPWTVWGGPAAPQSVAGESSIYQSYVYGNPDYTLSMLLPNGNYAIRVLAGVTNRGGNLTRKPAFCTLLRFLSRLRHAGPGTALGILRVL